MNIKTVLAAASRLAARLFGTSASAGWLWIGDDDASVLFEKKFEHDEFFVVARLAIDEDSGVDARFSDVWKPGAMLLPKRWKEHLSRDIQWYVPRQGLKASGVLQDHMQSDIQVALGERPLYRLDVEIWFGNECLIIRGNQGLVLNLDDYNFVEVEEITASLAEEAVAATRRTRLYEDMVLGMC